MRLYRQIQNKLPIPFIFGFFLFILSLKCGANTPDIELTVVAGNNEVTATFTENSAFSSYNLYRSTSAGSLGIKIEGVSSPYTDLDLINGFTYYYTLKGVVDGSETSESGQVSATLAGNTSIPVPAPPTGLSVTAADTQVTLSWNPVADATSYNVYRSTTSGSLGIQIPNAVSPFTDTGLTNGVTYYYVITTANNSGESPASTQLGATPQFATTGSPQNIAAAPGNGFITLSWTAVNPGATYNIYWSTSSGVTTATGNKISNASQPYTHVNLTNGQPYYYIVTAVNGTIESPASAEVNSIPLSLPPAIPSGVSVSYSSMTSVIISWNSVPNTVNYNIYYSTTPGVNKSNGTKLTTTASQYNLTVPLNTTYYFVITSYNYGGESSESVEVNTLTSPAAPPTSFSAVLSSDYVAEISWVNNPEAFSYNIYWSNSPGVTTASSLKITCAASPCSVPYLTGGKTYYFIITSVNSAGEGPQSAEVSVSTPISPPTGLSIVSSSTQNALTWNATTGATSYNLYWSQTPGVTTTTGTKIANVTSPFNHTGLTNGIPYYYILTAKNSSGESSASRQETSIYYTYLNEFHPTNGVSKQYNGSSVTKMADGRVLIAGGQAYTYTLLGGNYSLIGSAFIYDPVSDTITRTTGDMAVPRYQHLAIALDDGRVLILGGTSATPETFNPATGTFTALASSMITPRYNFKAIKLANGNVLILGGNNTANGTYLNTAELFNATTNTFLSIASTMASTSSYMNAVVMGNGKVLILFGDSVNNHPINIFDPANNTFSVVASTRTTGPYYPSVTALSNGKVLLAGGDANGGYGGAKNSAEIFDPAANTITPTSSTMINPHSGHTALELADGRVMIFGGNIGFGSYQYIEYYDPNNDTFTENTAARLPYINLSSYPMLLNNNKILFTMSGLYLLIDPASGSFAPIKGGMTFSGDKRATLLPNGKVLLTGNSKYGELYDYTTGNFSVTAGTLTTSNRTGHRSTLLNNGKVLITGGTSSYAGISMAEVFDPATETFSPTAGQMTTYRINHTATLLSNGKVLITGGVLYTNNGPRDRSDTEIYDPITDSFLPAANMKIDRSQHVATLMSNGKVLIMGDSYATNSAEIYDPETNVFTLIGVTPSSIAGHSAVSLNDGRILISQAGWYFDPVTLLFSATNNSSPEIGPGHAAEKLVNGTILLTGGSIYIYPNITQIGATIFNPASGTYTATGTALPNILNFPRNGHTQTLLPNGKVLITSDNLAEIYE